MFSAVHHFFFHDTTTTEIYTLSLHDALPIYGRHQGRRRSGRRNPSRSRRDSTHDSAVDRKSTRLNSSHLGISYAVFCLKKKIKMAISRQIRTQVDKFAQALDKAPIIPLLWHE